MKKCANGVLKIVDNMTDKNILKTLENPVETNYLIKHVETEFTFLGVPNQPDYGKKIEISFIPHKLLIELKSLKLYFQQFRNHVYSYEHLINIIFDDIHDILKPRYLEVVMETNTRGGIYSILKVNSKHRS